MRFYEYRHRISFEETNVVGNVYYAHYVSWQGGCREMFIHDHAPQVLQDLAQGLTLATTRVSCSYYQELSALDEVLIRMSAGSMSPGRLTMLFQYFRVGEGGGNPDSGRRAGGGLRPARWIPSAARPLAGGPAPCGGEIHHAGGGAGHRQ